MSACDCHCGGILVVSMFEESIYICSDCHTRYRMVVTEHGGFKMVNLNEKRKKASSG